MMKIVGSILGVTALLGVFFGVHEWQDSRYAHTDALAQTNQRIQENQKKIDYHIINQQRETLEARVERVKAEYKREPTKDKKELLDDLQKRLAEKEKELKEMEKK